MSMVFKTEDELRSWLSRSRKMESEIERARESWRTAKDQAMRTTTNYSFYGRISGSRDPHAQMDAVARAADKVVDLLNEQAAVKIELLNCLYQSPIDHFMRALLLGYYLRGCSMEQVAKELDVCYRTARRIHKAALQAILSSGVNGEISES